MGNGDLTSNDSFNYEYSLCGSERGGGGGGGGGGGKKKKTYLNKRHLVVRRGEKLLRGERTSQALTRYNQRLSVIKRILLLHVY